MLVAPKTKRSFNSFQPENKNKNISIVILILIGLLKNSFRLIRYSCTSTYFQAFVLFLFLNFAIVIIYSDHVVVFKFDSNFYPQNKFFETNNKHSNFYTHYGIVSIQIVQFIHDE